ncbi:MAG TPA: biotin--[acetyl-CoA-carboxylase] ligase [Methylomirabilota bacterium]|nr:biotin--[acetyl-CoA-carboxylase] ligase [Methylomirabilota bacterium]
MSRAVALAADRLSIADIRRSRTTTTVGRHIYLFGEVDSTNARLRNLAQGGACAGTVVLAEGQTAGRGRHGNVWFSPSGVNLYASVLVRPELRAGDLGAYSLIAGLALYDAIKQFGATPSIKWPNDVLIADKKVGATLLECVTDRDAVEYVIFGVGVNLNVELSVLRAALGPAGDSATTLAAATGHAIDRNAFAAAYLNALERWVSEWDEQGSEAILTAWRRREILGGRRVQVQGPEAAWEGRVLGIDDHGRLWIEDTMGHQHALTGEEVHISD